MSSKLTIALAQFGSPPGDAARNRLRSVEAAVELFERGADLVLLPEMCVPWYSDDPSTLTELAEPLCGETVSAWRELAERYDGIVIGGFCELGSLAKEGGEGAGARPRIYNSAVAVGSDGVLCHYRKLHLFSTEKHCFEPGDLGLPTFQTPYGRIGICVCYDLRFVEVVRVLALQGADLICVPTAWVRGFDHSDAVGDSLIPQAQGAMLQSNLSQVFMACASQVGQYGKLQFLGSSILASPYGRLVTGPGSTGEPDLLAAEVDLAEAKSAQARSPLIRPRTDRRTDVYGVTLGGRLL